MKPLTAAAIQIAAVPMDVDRNAEKAVGWLEKAAAEGVDLAVFPESASTGYFVKGSLEQVYELADEIPGRTTRRVQEAARDLGIHVVWATYERGPSRDVVYNASVLIDDRGDIVGVYRKTHPFGTEHVRNGGYVTPGSQAEVFETRLGRIGMIVCYDGDFPELSRSLALKGADIITRTSALMRPFDIWELTNRARAYDNHVYFIATNAVGPDASGSAFFYGHSMIVSPAADRLALAGAAEQMVTAVLDPSTIKHGTPAAPWPTAFHHLRDRNLAVCELAGERAPAGV